MRSTVLALLLVLPLGGVACRTPPSALERLSEDDVFIHSHGFGWGSDGRATRWIHAGAKTYPHVLPFAQREAKADGEEVRYRVLLLACLATEVRRSEPVDRSESIASTELRTVDAPEEVLALLGACLVSENPDLRGLARLVAGEVADARTFVSVIDHLEKVAAAAAPAAADAPNEVQLALALLQDLAQPNGLVIRPPGVAPASGDEPVAGLAAPWSALVGAAPELVASPPDAARLERLIADLRDWRDRRRDELPVQARW